MHTLMQITAWEASRSGAGMTIKGTAAPMGRPGPVRIPNVRRIASERGKVIATDIGNQRYELA